MAQEDQVDEQAGVLEEAAVGLEGWADRLPEDAPWRQGFKTIAGELRTCLEGRAAMRSQRAA